MQPPPKGTVDLPFRPVNVKENYLLVAGKKVFPKKVLYKRPGIPKKVLCKGPLSVFLIGGP